MVFGYLDPVTGSAIFQVLLGALAAVGLGWQYVRKGWNTMLARFRGESPASTIHRDETESPEIESNAP